MAKMIRLFGFASLESSEAVKEFLEEHIGEGTVSDVKVGQNEGSRRARAIVEFSTKEAANLIKSLAAELRLSYGNSYLKASDARRRTLQYKFNDLNLNFGSQISMDKFSVLWSQENVSVKLCSDLRKFKIFLSYESVDYKLEVSYESIWQIELHRPYGDSAKYLVIQLFGAPMIYERDIHWVREVDFTPSPSTGQSSAICLELSSRAHVPKALKDFFYYKESRGKFTLVPGSSFSCYYDLVPMTIPPQGINLPFKILFEINSLVQHGCIVGPALDAKFFCLVDPSKIKMAYIKQALETLFHLRKCCYEPVRWLREQYRKYVMSGRLLTSPSVALEDGLVYVNKVLITLYKVYFCSLEISLSDRMLRSYPGVFLSLMRIWINCIRQFCLLGYLLQMNKGILEFIKGYSQFYEMGWLLEITGLKLLHFQTVK